MTTREQQPRSTPAAEWLERSIRVWAEWTPILHTEDGTYVLSDADIARLAHHLRGNWLQVESLEVEMLVRAAKATLEITDWWLRTSHHEQLRLVSGPKGDAFIGKAKAARNDAAAALAPFDKPQHSL